MRTVLHTATPKWRDSFFTRIVINVGAGSARSVYRDMRRAGIDAYVARKATIGSIACWPGVTVTRLEAVSA